MLFYTTPNGGTVSEAGRFDTSGNFMVGTNAAVGSAKMSTVSSGTQVGLYAKNNGSSAGNYGGGTLLETEALDPTKTGWYHLYCVASGTPQAFIRGDGNMYNTNGVYTTTSDEDYKNWEDVPQQNYREGIKSLWIGNFDRFDSKEKLGEARRMFGVRAQQAYNVLGGIGIVPGANDKPWEAQAEPFAFVALWGVKDLYKIIDDLTTRLAALESK
jgi:hypothetical protein